MAGTEYVTIDMGGFTSFPQGRIASRAPGTLSTSGRVRVSVRCALKRRRRRLLDTTKIADGHGSAGDHRVEEPGGGDGDGGDFSALTEAHGAAEVFALLVDRFLAGPTPRSGLATSRSPMVNPTRTAG